MSAHPFAGSWNHNAHYYPLIRSRVRGARTVLDVGCGEGTFCRYLAEPGRAVVGLDPDLHVLPSDPGDDFVGGSAESLPFASDTFDAVTMTMVLHHVSTERALGEAARVLVPGGRLVVLGYGRYGGPRDAVHEARDLLAHRWHSSGKQPWEPATARQPPDATWAEAERALRRHLPACGYRRLPMWRYLATWRKP